MAGGYTRRCAPRPPAAGRIAELDRSDWLVEVISTGEVLIVTDRTYLELCDELDQIHPGDWELWDRE